MQQYSTDVAHSDRVVSEQERLELSGPAAEISVVPSSTDVSQDRSYCASRAAVTKLEQELAETNVQLAELCTRTAYLEMPAILSGKQMLNQRNKKVWKTQQDLE